jgi:exodeoxyribonuclease-3
VKSSPEKKIKIVSWNVNGIRAVLKKGLLDWLARESPDILCLQEIKARSQQLPPELLYPAGYHVYWNSALRPGYSGVAVFTKQKPVSVKNGLGVPRFDEEGRVLELEFENFRLFNIYFPNGKMNAERLRYKLDFYEESLRAFRALAGRGERIVVCGDYNTAHKPVDLARPRENEKVSGFLPVEREWMDRLSAGGFLDTFRLFTQDPGHYTWWDTLSRARERNVGWRIDYHFISSNLRPHLRDAFIQPEVLGSDHCPVGILLHF